MEQRESTVEKMGLKKNLGKFIEQFKKHSFKDAIKNITYHILTREQKRSFGTENEGKTIYIIRSIAEKSPFYIGPVYNLLANYFYVLSHIQYAREKDWIPVVDELNYPVYNSQDEPVNGTTNPWEFFWKQPGGISLESAYRSENVVLSKQNWFWEWDMSYDPANYENKDTVSFFHDLSECAQLNDFMKEHVAQAVKRTFPPGKRILGVNVRIGGHAKASEEHGKGHPIQPEIEELIQIVQLRLREWNMDIVLLACDTEHAVKYFKEAFGDTLIVFQRRRAALGTEFLEDPQKNLYAPGNGYQTALDYLTEMELLSQCNALIGSITSGFRYAVVRNGGRYEQLEVIDRGRFSGRY